MKVNQQHRHRQPKGELEHEGRGSADDRRGAPQAGQVKDATPGREFQGSGMLNKAGRFGSSTGAEQLTAHDERKTGARSGKG